MTTMTLCVVAVKIALIQALTCYEVAYASHCGGEKTSVVRNGRAYCYNEVVNRVAPE